MNGPTQRVTAILLVVLQTISYIIALMPPAALAQQAKAGDPLTLPRYRVEILIFRHLEQNRTTEEFETQLDLFLPPNFDVNALTETPDTPTHRETTGMGADKVVPLGPGHAAASVEFLLLDPLPSPPNFVQLVAAQFKLTKVWDKLNQIEAYGPVLHIAWLQSARRETEAVPYDLVITAADPDIITGNLTLYKQRFLHLEIDLTMRGVSDMKVASASGFSSPSQFSSDNEESIYRMNQSRRIRAGNLQYFDHPWFGVISAVTECSLLSEVNALRNAQNCSEAL